MTDRAPLLDPFDDEPLETIAADHGMPDAELRDALAAHQRQVRANPGVEDLVYEWRTQFHEQTLLHQTEDVYYLRVRSHIWEEFGEALSLGETELTALMAVHETQVSRDVEADLQSGDPVMVLTRE